MDTELVTGVLKLVLPPAVGAVVATTVGGLLKRAVRPARLPETRASGPGTWKGSGASTSTWPAPPPAEDAPRIGRSRRIALSVWELLDRLPPLKRRTSRWQATLLGSVGFGFGIAAYFRTKADVLVGLVLSIPILVAAGLSSETSADPEASPPALAVAMVYPAMALTGLYSYLRVVSSNRRLDEARPPGRRSAAERKETLTRELQRHAERGWRVHSVGDFEAVISRIRRPNHVLHLVLTFLTVYVWGVVWIYLTLEARKKQEREYRHAFVDDFGNWSLEPLEPQTASGPAPG